MTRATHASALLAAAAVVLLCAAGHAHAAHLRWDGAPSSSTPQPQVGCLKMEALCSRNSECCSDCCMGDGRGGQCFDLGYCPATCKRLGQSCTEGSDCCMDGPGNPPLQTCRLGKCFACRNETGDPCEMNADCCLGMACGRGQCCMEEGGDCTGAFDSCCGGLKCQEGTSLPPTWSCVKPSSSLLF